MISVVVCSVNTTLFNEFSECVSSSIGVPYEIIRIDNSGGKYSICEAYNKGAALCNHDIICFVHEDVFFETKDWGKIVATVLADRETGLLGVVGTCYLSLFPDTWLDENELEGQWVYADKKTGEKTFTVFKKNLSKQTAEVVAVDGFFLATRKDVLQKVRFSDDLLKGFHGYDIDICMQVHQHYKVVINRNLIFHHFSAGNYNNSYYYSLSLLKKKWFKKLPAYISSYTKKEIEELKLKSLDVYFKKTPNREFDIRYKIAGLKYALQKGVLFQWLARKRQLS